jgi:hypothetical protein
MRFSGFLAVGAMCMALVACGGGDGSKSGTAVDATSSSGGSASCTSNPVLTSATTFYGVTPAGGVGTWTFDTAALTSHYTVGASTSSTSLVRDAASCSYTSASMGVLRTAFASSSSNSNADLAVSAASVAGMNTSALLMASPETVLANAAGTYNLMIIEYERSAGGSTVPTSTFATLQVDAAGAWSLCREASYSSTCGGPTGSLTTHAGGGGFDMVSGGNTLGRVFVKASGLKKVMTVAFNDTTQSSTTVSGMWVGATTDVWVPGVNDGVYVTNTNQQSSSLHTLTGLTIKPIARPTAAPLIANQPVQGAFEIVTGDTAAGILVNDVGIVSSLGIYADVAKSNSTSSGFIRFGVKP